MAKKFLSQEWCDEAKEIINASDATYKGFKDPANFTHKMYFGCLDNDTITHLTFEKAKITYWGPPIHDASEIGFGIKGNVESWREAAEGTVPGGKLLMGGKLKVTDGNIQLAIQNAGAFENFLLCWGQIDTDWDI